MTNQTMGVYLYFNKTQTISLTNSICLPDGTRIAIIDQDDTLLHCMARIQNKLIEGYMSVAVLELKDKIGIIEIGVMHYKKYKIWMPDGMNLRFHTRPLTTHEMRTYDIPKEVSEKLISTEIFGLASGTIVELIKTEGQNYFIKVTIDGKEFYGFVVTLYNLKPTLIPVDN